MNLNTPLDPTAAMSSANELVSCAICTRNRGESLVVTIESILKQNYSPFELVIIDQSSDNLTEKAVQPFLSDARVRYIHTTSKGLARCRNEAVDAAHGEIILFTDDDCEVNDNWLETMIQIFKENPAVAIAFCNVVAPPYDRTAGFIPEYVRTTDKLVTNMRGKCHARGIGAGLAVRKSAVLSMGGFDSVLGAGGEFYGCEDGDIAVRALLLGYHVYETCRTSVLHFGFRAYSEGRSLSKRDFFGIAAAYIKPVKSGHWAAFVVLWHEFAIHAVMPLFQQVLRGKKPQGISRVTSYLQGIVVGMRTPVEKSLMLYRLPEKTTPSSQ